jgi:hypothetical protein
MSESKRSVVKLGYMGSLKNEKGETTGVKGVGKDTSADILQDLFGSGYESRRLAFADGLKDLVAAHYGLNRSFMDTPSQKEAELKHYPGWTWRRLLEDFGTNVIREGMGNHFPELREKMAAHWCSQVEYKIKREQLEPSEALVAQIWELSNRELFDYSRDAPLPGLGRSFNELHRALVAELQKHEFPDPHPGCQKRPVLIQITDVRFPNEYERLKALGVHMVCVSRVIPGLKPPEVVHPSNRVYEEMVPDTLINNSESRMQLRKKMLQLKCSLLDLPEPDPRHTD